MKKELRTAVYDHDLHIEAYRLQGIIQPFPPHFHEHYVVGYVESGERRLTCRNQEYLVPAGYILLFNPGDSHGCVQTDGGTFDYRGLNIPKEVIKLLAQEITGSNTLPYFSRSVFTDEEIACCLRTLHEMILVGSREFGKEAQFLLLLSLLIQKVGQPFHCPVPPCREEIEQACAFMETHLSQRISLDDICREVGLSKSTLLRAFTKSKGVTPYSYLESIHIDKAKKMLEQGIPPASVALETGFSDQSHFTNYFSRFIGLSPGMYQDIFSESSNREDLTYGP